MRFIRFTYFYNQNFEKLMQRFMGVDYFDVESLLKEDEIMVRDSVREFVDNEIIPIIEKSYREDKFLIDHIPKLAKMGLLNL